MSIIRKILSVIVVNAAVFMITLSFMAWVFDTKLLDAPSLTGALKDNGVAKAIADAIPEMTVPEEQHGPDGEIKPQDPAEVARVKDTIKKAIDEPYIQKKIDGVVTNVIGFVKTGEPAPTLDLTDFPARVAETTGEVPEELQKNLAEPIDLSEKANKNAVESIRKSYDVLSLFKVLGPVLAVLLLMAEWFLTPKGKRLGKTAWVFIAAGMWSLLWWFLLSRAPDLIMTKVESSKQTENALAGIVSALLNSISSLLTQSFLWFTIACFGVAAVLLAVRFALAKLKPTTTGAVPSPRPVAPPSKTQVKK
jgi:hypothetical protein